MSLPNVPTLLDIYRICVEQEGRDYTDLRDRAAYLELIGGFPTHLRPAFTKALSHISYFASDRKDHKPSSAGLRIKEDVRSLLALDDHPMVKKVRALEAEGYELRSAASPKARRGFSRVRMGKGGDEIIVQIDGSILDQSLS